MAEKEEKMSDLAEENLHIDSSVDIPVRVKEFLSLLCAGEIFAVSDGDWLDAFSMCEKHFKNATIYVGEISDNIVGVFCSVSDVDYDFEDLLMGLVVEAGGRYYCCEFDLQCLGKVFDRIIAGQGELMMGA